MQKNLKSNLKSNSNIDRKVVILKKNKPKPAISISSTPKIKELTVDKNLSKNLLNYRIKNNLKQKEMAMKLKITAKELAEIESNKKGIGDDLHKKIKAILK